MLLLKILLNITTLSAVVLAIPTSILEDLKNVQLQSPIRSNKVKRAQEFIMFGNQQNRAPSFSNIRNDKRASEIDDNSLPDDEGPLPQVVPQADEATYENNHLTSGNVYDKAYPYTSRDLYYNMLLRNLELTQNLHNDPVFNYDFPSYSIMDGRFKRDTKSTKESHKPLYRSKREHVLNPEEFLALMKMADSNKDINNKYYDRSSIGWPVYESEIEDFPGVDDDTYETESNDENGAWYNNGMMYQSRFGHPKDGFRTNRPHKRFMVSKRRMGAENAAQYNMPYGVYDPSDGIPLHRRFLL
ncbi:uncharacterized protein [Rhodnius prolixus]|uniref:uncharacterized protein n=1 Tax=Rhodnius prolixus TaxID=13249 RepID=UPI003D18836B